MKKLIVLIEYLYPKLFNWSTFFIVGMLFNFGCSKDSTFRSPELNNNNGKQKSRTSVMSSGDYVIMTYNVRYDAPDTGNRNWNVRRPLVKDRILANGCDIVGVQEALGNQISNLETDLPGYMRIGIGRDGDSNSEHSAIFFRSARFSLLSSGTFWLSPGAPTTPTGPSWDAAFRRICTWAQFQDKTTSLKFWVFNSHFDHQGATAQQNSANLILSQMQAKIGVQPAIFMGDLNANQTSAPYTILNNSDLLEETWNVAETKAPALRVTGNSWSVSPTGNNEIDHIFVTGEWTVSSRLVDWYHQDPGNIVPSDHWPVIAQMKINGVTFYQDANYGGAVSQILPVGNYTLSQLQARGMPNDWASSVRIPAGRTLIMYEDNNFSGISWTRTSDTPLFSALSPTANDKVSSVKVQ